MKIRLVIVNWCGQCVHVLQRFEVNLGLDNPELSKVNVGVVITSSLRHCSMHFFSMDAARMIVLLNLSEVLLGQIHELAHTIERSA